MSRHVLFNFYRTHISTLYFSPMYGPEMNRIRQIMKYLWTRFRSCLGLLSFLSAVYLLSTTKTKTAKNQQFCFRQDTSKSVSGFGLQKDMYTYFLAKFMFLLNYSWSTIFYWLMVFNIVTQHLYTLQNGYHNKLIPSSTIQRYYSII